jgi:large subunit ribosomal protein L4
MAVKKDFKYSVQGSSSEEFASMTLRIPEKNSRYLLHRAIVNQQKGRLQGTSNTKTRSEVRGGGKKPWKQKGTGRARAGSSNSPLWRGGGVSFGPRSGTTIKKMNNKEWRLALNSALQASSNSVTVVKDTFFELNNANTKEFKSLLGKTNVSLNEKILVVTKDKDDKLNLSARNLPNVTVIMSNSLNIRAILMSDNIIFTESALKNLQEVYNEQK